MDIKTAGITLELLAPLFSVCKVTDYSGIDIEQPFVFVGRTDLEKSLVCPTEIVPLSTVAREDGWRGFRIVGRLNFSLIGILAGITNILASGEISVFAVSTYDTDYVLIKENDFDKAIMMLRDAGYSIKDHGSCDYEYEND